MLDSNEVISPKAKAVLTGTGTGIATVSPRGPRTNSAALPCRFVAAKATHGLSDFGQPVGPPWHGSAARSARPGDQAGLQRVHDKKGALLIADDVGNAI
jgi:hypothetical protein